MKRNAKKFLSAVALTFMMTLLCGMVTMAATTIKPTLISSFGSSTSKATTYTITIPAGGTVVHPVTVSNKGYVKLDLTASGLSNYVYGVFCTDSAGTKVLDASNYAELYSSTSKDSAVAEYASKGTYYLRLLNYNTKSVSVKVKAYYYSGENKTLKNKTWSGTYQFSNSSNVYHKVVVKKTGYIKVQGYYTNLSNQKAYLSNVTLYNSKKKAVSGTDYLQSGNNYTRYFGVKKGTYYIGVKDKGMYNLKYTFTAVKDKNISSKKKATTLKSGSTAKGLFIAGEAKGKTDWYKIKVTKTKKIKIKINSKASGNLRVQLTTVGGYIRTVNAMSNSDSVTLTPGTYYIKVSKYPKNTKTSGYYTINWK